MTYNKKEQVDFIKQVIYDYQLKIDNEENKSTKYMLNDILDLYYSVLDTLEKS